MRSAQDEAAFGTLEELLTLAKLPNVAIKATGAELEQVMGRGVANWIGWDFPFG